MNKSTHETKELAERQVEVMKTKPTHSSLTCPLLGGGPCLTSCVCFSGAYVSSNAERDGLHIERKPATEWYACEGYCTNAMFFGQEQIQVVGTY